MRRCADVALDAHHLGLLMLRSSAENGAAIGVIEPSEASSWIQQHRSCVPANGLALNVTRSVQYLRWDHCYVSAVSGRIAEMHQFLHPFAVAAEIPCTRTYRVVQLPYIWILQNGN